MFFQGCFKKKFPQNARGVCGRSGRLAFLARACAQNGACQTPRAKRHPAN